MSSEIEKVVAEMRDAVQSGEPMKFRYLSEWAGRLEAATPPSSATPGDGITPEWVIGYFPSDVDSDVKDTVHAAFAEYAAIYPPEPQPQERAGSDAGVDSITALIENTAADHGEAMEVGPNDGWFFTSEELHSFAAKLVATRPQPASDAEAVAYRLTNPRSGYQTNWEGFPMGAMDEARINSGYAIEYAYTHPQAASDASGGEGRCWKCGHQAHPGACVNVHPDLDPQPASEDAEEHAIYVEHCAEKLCEKGLRRTGNTLKGTADFIRTLSRALAESRANDARYRWLRQYHVDSYLACGSEADLDAAIDAARAVAAQQQEGQ